MITNVFFPANNNSQHNNKLLKIKMQVLCSQGLEHTPPTICHNRQFHKSRSHSERRGIVDKHTHTKANNTMSTRTHTHTRTDRMFSLFAVHATNRARDFYCYCAAILKPIKFYGSNPGKTHSCWARGPEAFAWLFECVCVCVHVRRVCTCVCMCMCVRAVGVDIARTPAHGGVGHKAWSRGV